MKKILSIFLTLSIVFGTLPVLNGVTVFAVNETAATEATESTETTEWEYEEFTYGEAVGIAVTKYLGTQTDMYVPAEIDNKPVLKLGDGLFADNDSINSVTLSPNIVVIGANAFADADNLVCIVTNEGLVEIGANAFNSCDSFNSVILYNAVTTIDATAFTGCAKLTVYCYEGSNAHTYVSENSIPYELINADATPEMVTVDGIYYLLNGEAVIMGCSEEIAGELVIPERVNNYPVTMINDAVFKGMTGITSVKLPDCMRYIGKEAFYGCSGLSSINVPAAVTAVNEYTFYNCTSLRSVSLPKGLKSIGNYAFMYCTNLPEIEFPDGIINIDSGTFAECYKLQYAYLPESITSLGTSVFHRCRELLSNNIPDKITEIPENLFYGANFTEIEIPYGITKIGSRAFYNSAIEKINIPDTVTELGNEAFYQTKLKKIDIPESVTSTGTKVFYGCKELTEVTLPGTLTSIQDIFTSCNSLTEVTIPEGVESLYGTFKSCGNLKKVKLPETLTIISEAFSSCTSLTDINLPGNLKSIGKSSFSGTAIESWDIPDSVKTIGSNAFSASKVKEIKLPASLTEINSNTFWNCTSLEKITIPEGVTTIRNYAFYGCTALEEINLPDSLTNILYNVFENCTALENIVIPDSVTQMAQRNFLGCTSLKSVILSDNLGNLYTEQFKNCTSLSYVKLPSNLYSIDGAAFAGCTSLKSIVIPSSVQSINGAVFPMDTVLYLYKNSYAQEHAEATGYSYKIIDAMPEVDNLTFEIIDGEAVVTDCIDSAKGEIVIPEAVQGYPVTKIGYKAFQDCAWVTSVIIPDSVTVIDTAAFLECTGLQSVTMSQKITTIGESAFYNCSSLSEITLPDSLTSLGKQAFIKCTALESIVIPDGITEISEGAFIWCRGLKNVVLPEKLTTIGKYAFEGCAFTEIDIPETVTIIDDWAFAYSDLETVVLPKNLTTLGNEVFSDCTSLKNVNIPDSIEKIPVALFLNCSSLEKIELHNNIKSIESVAFEGCSALKELNIPDSVEAIGKHVFAGCSSLEGINLPEGIDTIGKNLFLNCSSLKSFRLPENVTAIDNAAFSGCTALENIIWNDKIEQIGARAFYNCQTLTAITIPSTVRRIEEYAFARCGLTQLQLPATVEYFGQGAFSELDKLEKAVLASGIEKIVSDTFYHCDLLTEVEIPDTVTSIDSGAFSYCTALKEMILPESVKTIGSGAFKECSVLTDIALAEGLRVIGTNAFEKCTAMNQIIIPEGVTAINRNTFLNCTNLKKIVLPQSVASVEKNAFEGCSAYIVWVYKDSYAHSYAVDNNIPYFIIHKTGNPEILYGTTLKGNVSYIDESAAANATVEILYDDGTVKECVTTDENGAYEFTYAEVGRYTIRATDTNGNTSSETVSVKRMNVFDVFVAGTTDIVLKKGYTVSGSVSPYPATVTITDTDGNVIVSVKSTDGTYSFNNIPNGTYIIKAENESGSISKEIHIFGENISLETLVIPTESATITGEVEVEGRDKSHYKKVWVSVTLYNSDGNAIAHTKTDSEGKYIFENVPIGEYSIVAETEEMRPDKYKNFDRNHKLTGYAYIDVVENIEYTAETIVLYEENEFKTTISGKVTAQGESQKCEVILSNVFRHEIARTLTGNNGKYTFKNISDGLYFVTAITKSEGMGFVIVMVINGEVYGDTDIMIRKSDRVQTHENDMKNIPDCDTKEEAEEYRKWITDEKRFYDSLPEKEKTQFSKEYLEKLNKLIELLSQSSYDVPDGFKVKNGESIISGDEIEKEYTVEFVLAVEEKSEHIVSGDGIKNSDDYIQKSIDDTAGDKQIVKYYDIKLSKNGKDITNVKKYTDTTGKLRITMDIPGEYRGHKHYTLVHMHNGVPQTLVDLDDDPNTITFEVDKFSTFALAYSDVELTEAETTAASIAYDETEGKISVTSTESGTLYVATYNGDKLSSVVKYDITAGGNAVSCDFDETQAAFVWSVDMKPLCGKFTIN